MEGMAQAQLEEFRKKNAAKLEDKARAQITWGDPPEKVMTMLRAGGMADQDVQRLMRKLLSERAASFKERGQKDLMAGGTLSAAMVIFLFLSSLHILNLSPYLMGLACFGVGAGLWLIARGVDRVRNPEKQRGADTIY